MKKKPPRLIKLPKRETKEIITFADSIEILNRALDLFVATKLCEQAAQNHYEIVKVATELYINSEDNLKNYSKNFLDSVEKIFHS